MRLQKACLGSRGNGASFLCILKRKHRFFVFQFRLSNQKAQALRLVSPSLCHPQMPLGCTQSNLCLMAWTVEQCRWGFLCYGCPCHLLRILQDRVFGVLQRCQGGEEQPCTAQGLLAPLTSSPSPVLLALLDHCLGHC